MNRNKIGAPYKCTDSQIGLLTGPHIGFGTACRTAQGACRGPSEAVKIPEIHFTQTRRRMLQMRPEISNPNLADAVGLAFDSSGPSVTNNGTCLEHKWKRQGREYARLHVSVDLKSKKIVSYRITHGNGSDTKQSVPLLGDAKRHCTVIKSAHAGKAYDDQNNFECCETSKAVPAIRIRKNAVPHIAKSKLRRKEILHVSRHGSDEWKRLKDAGKRWIVEIAYSALKRVLGEKLHSRRFDAQCVEAGFKALLYNRFLDA